jgi:hypothetical protein
LGELDAARERREDGTGLVARRDNAELREVRLQSQADDL